MTTPYRPLPLSERGEGKEMGRGRHRGAAHATTRRAERHWWGRGNDPPPRGCATGVVGRGSPGGDTRAMTGRIRFGITPPFVPQASGSEGAQGDGNELGVSSGINQGEEQELTVGGRLPPTWTRRRVREQPDEWSLRETRSGRMCITGSAGRVTHRGTTAAYAC